MKRLFSLLLALVLILSAVPAGLRTAHAEKEALPQRSYAEDGAQKILDTPKAPEPKVDKETGIVTIPFQVNPLYQGIFTAEDFLSGQNPPALYQGEMEAGGSSYLSPEELVASVRQCLKNRETSIRLYVCSWLDSSQEIVDEIMNAAMAHTGDPLEGDYLLWQYGGWGGSYSRKYDSSTGMYYYDISLDIGYLSTAQQEAELTVAVDKLLDDLNLAKKTDYEKIYLVYDYLCQNISYDYDNLYDDSYTLKHTAYAALMHKTAVCQGYALLFYRLMLELGIDCRLIAGIGNGGAHGWNIVELDGLYYNLDSTWDADQYYYSYFLNSFWDFTDHERYIEYDTIAFHNAYPMAAETYQQGVPGSADPFINGGYCGANGNNVVWLVARDGSVILTGNGKIEDYSEAYPYFYYWADELTKAVIDEGITNISDLMFYEFYALEEVELPGTVDYIGVGAFAECFKLKKITFLGDAPDTIGDRAFLDVTATAYYPKGNATWKKSIMQDYGGDITWVAYGNEPACSHKNTVVRNRKNAVCTQEGYTGDTYCADCEALIAKGTAIKATGHTYKNGVCEVCAAQDPTFVPEKFGFVGVNMTLGNALDMNFFVKQSDIQGSGNYAVITKHYADNRGDQTVKVPQSQWESLGNSMYYFTFSGISAKEMADEFDVVIYNAEGIAISETYTDSIRDYSRRMLDKPETKDKDKSLYVEMLNYGTAAQVKFGYDTAHPANSVVTSQEQKTYGMEKRTYENLRQTADGYIGTSLTLESRILFNVVFSGAYASEGCYAVATFVNHNGKTMKDRVDNLEPLGSYMYASFTTMSVADRSQLLTITLYDPYDNALVTVQDTVEGYVARMEKSDPLYESIMRFADAAYLYFHDCVHSWGGWYVVTEPTATAEGLEARCCSKCGAEETQPIPKKNLHSDLYIEGVSVEQVITWFNEVCLDAEYGASENSKFVQKWEEPIYYYYDGSYTQKDVAVLKDFVDDLNYLEGFPGIYMAKNMNYANMQIYFCEPDEFPGYVGNWAYGLNLDGAVSFWYNGADQIYDEVICYSTTVDQYTRNSVILEEIYNGLGPVQDTVLRSDSIIYQYFSEPQKLTEVDWLILKLLYHEDMKCGYNAEECEEVIRSLYY